MELWEVVGCIKAYNQNRVNEEQSRFRQAYHTALLVGQAFAGKLRRLSYYLPDETQAEQGEILTGDEKARLDEAIRQHKKKEEVGE